MVWPTYVAGANVPNVGLAGNGDPWQVATRCSAEGGRRFSAPPGSGTNKKFNTVERGVAGPVGTPASDIRSSPNRGRAVRRVFDAARSRGVHVSSWVD